MRWGVRDEASIDHTTTEIVVDEVKKSMKLSRGPYLVVSLILDLSQDIIGGKKTGVLFIVVLLYKAPPWCS